MKTGLAPHLAVGRFGEKAAVRHLKKQGYKILKRNWRWEKWEIDIIAQKGDYTVFTEVKTRRQSEETSHRFGQPAGAVTKDKIEHIRRGAAVYLGLYPQKGGMTRFDVVEITLDPTKRTYQVLTLNHMEGAF